MLRAAEFQTKIEPSNEFVLIDGTEKRADLQVYNYKGRKACFDVSVTHPALLLRAKGSNTIPEAGKTASKCEQMKYDTYKEIAKAAGISFYPLVHEVYGRVGIQPHNLLKVCVAKIAALRRQPVASVIYYWRARLSVSLQISQARAIYE